TTPISQSGFAWMRTARYDQSGTFNQANDVAFDNFGQIVSAGSADNGQGGTDFAVAKISGSGSILWFNVLPGEANGFDEATAIVADHMNNVIAAGYVSNSVGGTDLAVASWDSQGNPRWSKMLRGDSPLGHSRANAVTVDKVGNVIVAGEIV